MQILYTLISFVASLALFPVFLLHPRGRRRILERYGIWRLPHGPLIWFHGASVGELAGMLPLMAGFRARYPEAKILISATSATGLDRAQAEADYCRLLPFDHPLWIRLALTGVDVKLFVFGETEIWPCLIDMLSRRKVPLHLVNGRISEFSLRSYSLLKPLLRNAFSKLETVQTLNEKYRERFIQFGAAPESVYVAGSAKYDIEPSVASAADAAELKRGLFRETAEYPVLVLGSLRPGEEEFWFAAIRTVERELHSERCGVIVAPRHAEKFGFFADRLASFELAFQRWSDPGLNGWGQQKLRLLLLDTMGKLEPSYSFADAAFVGATMVPGLGGHNPLEPAAYGAAVALGPHCENIDDVVQRLEEHRALLPLTDTGSAAELLRRVVRRDPELPVLGKRAQAVWEMNRGASDRILARITTT